MSSRLQYAGKAQVAPGGAAIFHPPTNPLLVKDDVGKAKPSCYNLPKEEFAYGRPGNMDMEGAREVSMQWVPHMPSRGHEEVVTDFITLHRKAAGAKVTTPRDLKHFRLERDGMYRSPRSVSHQPPLKDDLVSDRVIKDTVIPSDVIPGFTYGRKVRPSTPIQEVISYRFAERSEQELHRFYTDFREVQHAARTQVRKIPLTNASRGHASTAKKAAMITESPKELFKISKFKRVTNKVKSRHGKPPGHEFDDVESVEGEFRELDPESVDGGSDYRGALGSATFPKTPRATNVPRGGSDYGSEVYV